MTTKWLGLDPSMTAFGWAVFQSTPATTYTGAGAEILEAGVWRTEADRSKGRGVMKDNGERVRYLGEQLDDLVQRIEPQSSFVEGLAFPPGRIRWSTISALARIRGLIDGVHMCRGVQLLELTPQNVKRVLIGRPGRADVDDKDTGGKEAVADRVLRIYPRLRDMLPKGKLAENVTDAAAVGHAGFFLEDSGRAAVARGTWAEASAEQLAEDRQVDAQLEHEHFSAAADYEPPEVF